MFMEGVNRTDQYFSHYSIFRKTELAPEICIWAYKLCTFQFFSNLPKTKPYITHETQRISVTRGKTGLEIRWRQTQRDAARPGTSTKPLVCLMRTPRETFVRYARTCARENCWKSTGKKTVLY